MQEGAHRRELAVLLRKPLIARFAPRPAYARLPSRVCHKSLTEGAVIAFYRIRCLPACKRLRAHSTLCELYSETARQR